ncbi:DUF6428 family protein [Mucilaginibacter sp. UR6-11]|uniref:DUF6428 family protein n=1 Tax=Mucilaginibacter sp. UR6-11 TaxID=1435644 RepID=UPI001E514288|nr:DUF6428 family protein [Mucilaginibacter sp. UR6-11]MCC8424939.1 DUF6428 family protein [Mucilaginibacter sp. UR6-11]
MNWQTFKQALVSNPGLHLQFQYADGKMVDPSFHITEIKQAVITAVDCGGMVNRWTETIVQLYEPAVNDQERSMTAAKALSIINIVEKSLQLDPDGIVKIEFGNTGFDARQMLPNDIVINKENLLVDLRADTVQCKAIERGGSCGTNDKNEACCTTETVAKPKVQLKNLVAATAVCTPGAGCC